MNSSPIRLLPLSNRPCEWSGCDWLWVDGTVPENDYVRLALDIELAGFPESAWLAFACDTTARLFVDGRLCHCGPPREAPPYFYYDVIDLVPALKAGRNRLELLVHHCGIAHQSHDRVPAGVMIRGEAVCCGTAHSLEGPRWRIRRMRKFRTDVHRLGHCLGFAEHHDLTVNEEPAVAPTAVGKFGEGPLLKPLARDLPQFEVEAFPHVRIEKRKAGIMIDMGCEVFGHVRAELDLPTASTFRICYAEGLLDGEVFWWKAGMEYFDLVTAPPGRHDFNSFEKRALRYIWIDNPDAEVVSASVTELRYPYPEPVNVPQDAFERKLFDLAVRTIRINSEDLLIDCPWRERAQYNDPFIYFPLVKWMFGDLTFARRYVRQLLRGIRQRGRMTMCYPSPPSATIIPDFALLFADQVLELYRLTGDKALLEESFPAAVMAHEAVAEVAGGDGLLRNVPGWNFLDNSLLFPRKPASSAMNAIYAGSAHALAEIAAILGDRALESRYRERFARVRSRWRECFLVDGAVLDADISPELAATRYVNYLHPSRNTAFTLEARVRFDDPGSHTLQFCAWSGIEVLINGAKAASQPVTGTWHDPALSVPVRVEVPGGPADVTVRVGPSTIDQEVFIGCSDPFAVDRVRIDGSVAVMKPWIQPVATQVSAAYAACFGMIEGEEGRVVLASVLRPHYYSNHDRHTTPLFVEITADPDKLRDNVLPCNTPWSLYYLCKGLFRHGMQEEARAHVRMIYGSLLQRSPTSLWEEWKDGSSLCHAWAAAPLWFLFHKDS